VAALRWLAIFLVSRIRPGWLANAQAAWRRLAIIMATSNIERRAQRISAAGGSASNISILIFAIIGAYKQIGGVLDKIRHLAPGQSSSGMALNVVVLRLAVSVAVALCQLGRCNPHCLRS